MSRQGDEKPNNRRNFIRQTAAGVGGLILPNLVVAQRKTKPVKVVCVGGHPDDPESGCGGTLALLASLGHSVTIIYLTTGEAGIEGKSHQEAARIRKQEALTASKILNAKAVFAGQVDGATIVDNEWINKLSLLIEKENPSLVFTHWPVDSHRDHQAASLLTIQAWYKAQRKYPLYFFEVLYGNQTTIFNPTDYVDISATQEQKRKALFAHASQDPASIYSAGHEDMEKFRAYAIGKKAAEAFIRGDGNSTALETFLVSS